MDTGVSDHYMVYVIRKRLGTQYNGQRMRRVRAFTSGNEQSQVHYKVQTVTISILHNKLAE